jgi:hypothetical protein
MWYICTTNCVDGNNNKTLSYTQYDAEVLGQHFKFHKTILVPIIC